jgi:hypothetical protein
MSGTTASNGKSKPCVPPQFTEQNGRHRLPFGLVALAVAGACAILFFFKPGHQGFYPVCHFHALTGLHCPGCGSLRALHELMHGNFITALHLNALLLFCLAGLAWLVVRFVLARFRGKQATFALPAAWLWTFLCLAVAFGVLRNIPSFSWLAP